MIATKQMKQAPPPIFTTTELCPIIHVITWTDFRSCLSGFTEQSYDCLLRPESLWVPWDLLSQKCASACRLIHFKPAYLPSVVSPSNPDVCRITLMQMITRFQCSFGLYYLANKTLKRQVYRAKLLDRENEYPIWNAIAMVCGTRALLSISTITQTTLTMYIHTHFKCLKKAYLHLVFEAPLSEIGGLVTSRYSLFPYYYLIADYPIPQGLCSVPVGELAGCWQGDKFGLGNIELHHGIVVHSHIGGLLKQITWPVDCFFFF